MAAAETRAGDGRHDKSMLPSPVAAMPESWSEGAQAPLLSPLLLAAFVACVTGAGALTNCSLLAVLFKSSTRGNFIRQ